MKIPIRVRLAPNAFDGQTQVVRHISGGNNDTNHHKFTLPESNVSVSLGGLSEKPGNPVLGCSIDDHALNPFGWDIIAQ